jgi:DHA1 family bicyclomycin/chloramphenicol resistance-like MFS transporter
MARHCEGRLLISLRMKPDPGPAHARAHTERAGHALPATLPPSRARAALALALLLGLQPVTTDVFLPALPALRADLGATMEQAQLTLSALMLAFGLAQLVWGPLADRVGRRPVLVGGLVVYALASIASVAAPTIEWLVAWRVLQGATLAAAVVCARAIVRDLYEPHEGAQVMSLAMSGLAVMALLGPLLGGLATAGLGWRAALAIVAACGALLLGWVLWQWPETARQRNPLATRPGPLFAQWGAIVRHPVFVAWSALMAASYGALFIVLAGSSFMFIGWLGVTPTAYGLAMASGSLSYMAGTFVCRRWVIRHGMAGTVRRGAFFTLVAGLGFVLPAAAGVQGWAALLLPQWLLCFGHGLHQPCGQAGAVGPFPRAAGAAAALAGFVLSLVAFGIGTGLGAALGAAPTSTLPYAAGIGIACAVVCLVAWGLVPRDGPAR